MRFVAALFFLFTFQNSYAQVQEFLNPIESKVLNINVKNTEEENIKKTAIEIFENYKLNALKIDEPSSKQICDLTKKVNEWTDCKGSRENNTKTTKYIGDFKDGKHHGFGKEILTNGTQFSGYYENNQRIYGLLNLPSSTIFVSYVVAGKIEGNVIQLDNKNGNVYIGGFSNAQKNGKGLLIDVNGQTSIGNFINGVFVRSIKEINAVADALDIGNANAKTPTQQASTLPACEGERSLWNNCFGTTKFHNGSVRDCEFKNGKCNGQGTLTERDGKYVGEWRDDKFNGQGTFTHSDGSWKYVGEWKDNAFNGQGTMTHAGGKTVGEFRQGKAHGKMLVYDTNGSLTHSTEWIDGKIVKKVQHNPNEQREIREKMESVNAKRLLAQNDIISQALNYINGFAENSSSSIFYAPINNTKGVCTYDLIQSSLTDALVSEMASQAYSSILGVGINSQNNRILLNNGDPNSIQILEKRGISFSQPYLNYISKVEGLGQFECSSTQCNPDRLYRAWKAIYSKCNGTKKAF